MARIHLFVRGNFGAVDVPPPEVPTEDDIMDLADIGIVYNSPGAAVANSNAIAQYITERANNPISLRVSGPQNSARNDRREPGTAYFANTIDVNVGGTGNPSSFVLYSEGGTIQNDQIVGSTPIMRITRGGGEELPLIMIGGLGISFVSNGEGVEFVTPGSATFFLNAKVTYTASGFDLANIDFDGWGDLAGVNKTPAGLRVTDADGLFVEGFQCNFARGHGVVVDRWNAGSFDGNVRNAEGNAFKGQNIAGTAIDLGRFESNKGYGLHIRDSGMNRYEGSKVAQDGPPSAWNIWLENNNGRGSDHAQTSGGYQYTQAKIDSSSLLIAGHSGWASNMWRIDEGSRNTSRKIESMRIEQSAVPNLTLVDNNTVSNNVTLPADAPTNQAITNWSTVWTNASFRPTAVKIGTPGTDERIRLTWPAGSFENTASPTSAYWRPFGSVPLSSPGTFIYEVEYSDVTGSGPAWCIAREAATERQSPRLGSFHIAPLNGGQAYAPLWNGERRKLHGKIVVTDARSDLSPGFDAWFPGMELAQDGAAQQSAIVYDIWNWKFWKIA